MRVASDHPALPGHFPGHAIVPGVVVLDAVVAEWCRVAASTTRITGIPSVKFLAPLFPDQDFEIVIREKAAGRFTFEVISLNSQIARGTMTYEAG